MQHVSINEVWSLWFSGRTVNELYLWGHTVLWWGRAGKIAEFSAALTIVIEIVGPLRLRRFGNSLHAVFTYERAKNALVSASKFFLGILARILETLFRALGVRLDLHGDEDPDGDKGASGPYSFRPALFLSIVLTLATVLPAWRVVFSFVTWNPFTWIIACLFLWLILNFYQVMISPLLVFVGALFFFVLSVVIDSFLIEPIAWILEREHVDKWIKLGAAVMLVAGFHFDLLAS